MRKLFKFLKPYAGTVFLILCVLMVQAYCDLSLPSYTSDIVNIGIQQGGVDETIPEEISEEELNKLLLFVPSKDQEEVQNAYEVSKDRDYDYDGTVYRLKDEISGQEDKAQELSDILGKPMLLVSGFESDSDMTKQMEEKMQEQMQQQMQQTMPLQQGQAEMPVQISNDMTVFEMFSMMDAAQRDEMVSQMDEGLKDMPDTIVEQAATVYIRSVYENLGLDMDAIQNSYILSTGGKMLALAALGMLASILVGLMASRVAASVGRETREKVFHKVVGFSNNEFDTFSTASLITRSTNDIQQIQILTVMILRMVLYAPIIAAGGIWKVFNTNVDMSWIIGLAVGLIFAVVIILFLVVMPKFKIVQKMVDRLNLVSREILTGLQVIRAFNTEEHEEKRFDRANTDLTKLNLFVNRAMTFMMR